MTYKHTMYSCYLAYITSAVINNLPALLFVTFNKMFGLTLEQLASIITFNFAIQILVDFIGAKYADKVGYRSLILTSQFFAILGIISLGTLPQILPNAYSGIIISTALNAVGSGLAEVIISPITEAIPGDAKASSMSLLHSFYCIGHMLTVILSTLYFKIFGIENWSILCVIWSAVPAFAFFMFLKVPINQLKSDDDGKSTSILKLFSVKILWLFLILMICAGAAEQSMAQWSSFFAETELHVSKQVADILGPCMFAFTMAAARILFAVIGKKADIRLSLFVSGIICVISYLIVSFCNNSFISLIGCTLCGFGSGILWPATLSLSAKTHPAGGTAMFAILALAGDVGCFAGPEVVARAASLLSDGTSPLIKDGFKAAAIFPLLIAIITITLYILRYRKIKAND